MRSQPKKAAGSRRLVMLISIGMVVVSTVGAGLMVARPWNSARESTLQRFSVSMSKTDAARLFGVEPRDYMEVRFSSFSAIHKLQLTYGDAPGNVRKFVLWGGNSFESQAALERLRSIAPNRLDERGNFKTVHMGKAELSYDPRKGHYYTGFISGAHFDTPARAQAFWAAARFIAFGPARRALYCRSVRRAPGHATLDTGRRRRHSDLQRKLDQDQRAEQPRAQRRAGLGRTVSGHRVRAREVLRLKAVPRRTGKATRRITRAHSQAPLGLIGPA